MNTTKCDDCKGTGYWKNYPPPPGYVLDMMDCCGVCCGTGILLTTTQPCPKCGDAGPHVCDETTVSCKACDHTFALAEPPPTGGGAT